eukprot:11176914-Lingulodinium_polyedra.AAC.1
MAAADAASSVSAATPVKKRRLGQTKAQVSAMQVMVDQAQSVEDERQIERVVARLRADRTKIVKVLAFLSSDFIELDGKDCLKRGTTTFAGIPNKYMKTLVPEMIGVSVTDFCNMPMPKNGLVDLLLWAIGKDKETKLPELELPVTAVLDILKELYNSNGKKLANLDLSKGPDF